MHMSASTTSLASTTTTTVAADADVNTASSSDDDVKKDDGAPAAGPSHARPFAHLVAGEGSASSRSRVTPQTHPTVGERLCDLLLPVYLRSLGEAQGDEGVAVDVLAALLAVSHSVKRRAVEGGLLDAIAKVVLVSTLSIF